jgi:hypothetical protein
MDAAGRISGQLEPDDFYAPASATTDGWIAAQNDWKTVALGQLIEIRLNSADTLVRPWIQGLSALHQSEHVAVNWGKT